MRPALTPFGLAIGRLSSRSALALLLCLACQPTSQPLLPSATAHWNAYEHHYGIEDDGTVHRDRIFLFRISPEGRVTDRRGALVATVHKDGGVTGAAGEELGWLGISSARRRVQDTPRFRIMRDGNIDLYADDGSTQHVGYWLGCTDASVITCSLITFLVLLRAQGHAPSTMDAGLTEVF